MRTGDQMRNRKRGRGILFGAAVGLLSFWGSGPTPADEKPVGSMCIGIVPDPTPGDRSLSNPAGGNRSWAYSVQVDSGPAQATSARHGVRIDGLALGASHLVRIRNQGELVTALRFTFERYGARDLCLWFKPLFETWSLWPMKDAAYLCSCSVEGDDDA